MKQKSNKTIGRSVIIVFLLVAIDQITKYLAIAFLKDKNPFVLIKDVFELQYLENQSAAFGVDIISILHRIFHFAYFEENPDAFLLCKMIFFVVLTLMVVFLLACMYLRIPENRRFRWFNWILIVFVAGAIGNCIDRTVHQYVVDFFYFKLIDFPIFNVADIYVVVATIAFIIVGLFYYKDEDYALVFPSPKKKRDKK